MNLLTIADGFGDSVAVPPWYPDFIKWPEIIQLMTKGVNLLNLSRYGAGNEYITHCLKNHITDRDLILVQWAKPERLDLVLSHNDVFTNFWNNVIASDSMYHSNIVETALSKFWISSASKTEPVIEYHQKYISSNQHKLRSQIYIDYAKLLLDRCKIKHHFMLTQDSYYLRDNVDSSINWIWHSAWQGMDSFRRVSKYASLDFGIAQPIPLVQFDFVKTYMMPVIDLPWRSVKEVDAVENLLLKKYKQSVTNKPK